MREKLFNKKQMTGISRMWIRAKSAHIQIEVLTPASVQSDEENKK